MMSTASSAVCDTLTVCIHAVSRQQDHNKQPNRSSTYDFACVFCLHKVSPHVSFICILSPPKDASLFTFFSPALSNGEEIKGQTASSTASLKHSVAEICRLSQEKTGTVFARKK